MLANHEHLILNFNKLEIQLNCATDMHGISKEVNSLTNAAHV